MATTPAIESSEAKGDTNEGQDGVCGDGIVPLPSGCMGKRKRKTKRTGPARTPNAAKIRLDGLRVGARAAKTRKTVRRACREAFRLAEDAIRAALAAPVKNQNGNVQRAAAYLLYRKILDASQSVVASAELGLDGEALVLVRVSFDALVLLKMHREDEKFWKVHQRAQQPFRRRSRELAVENRLSFTLTEKERARDRVVIERIKQLEAKAKKLKSPLELRTRDLARRADVLEGARLLKQNLKASRVAIPLTFRSLTLSALANQPTHSTLPSLRAYGEVMLAGEDRAVPVEQINFYLLETTRFIVWGAIFLEGVFGDDADISAFERPHGRLVELERLLLGGRVDAEAREPG